MALTIYRNYLILILGLVMIYSCQPKQQSHDDTKVVNDGSESIVHQEGESQTNRTTIQDVSDIKKEFAAINKLLSDGQLDSSVISYECHGERPGEIVYYTAGDNVRMIKHSYSEYSHFSSVEKFYLEENTLFFAFYDELAWSFGEGGTVDKITEKRFYFVEKKPIQCLEKHFETVSESSSNPQSDEVANKEVSCNGVGEVYDRFERILSLQGTSGFECIDE